MLALRTHSFVRYCLNHSKPQLLIQKLGLFFFPHGGNETSPFSSSQNKTPEYALLTALTLAFSIFPYMFTIIFTVSSPVNAALRGSGCCVPT